MYIVQSMVPDKQSLHFHIERKLAVFKDGTLSSKIDTNSISPPFFSSPPFLALGHIGIAELYMD